MEQETPSVPVTPTLRRTPLHDTHAHAKARIVPFAGWEMPVQYATGVLTEVKAVRTGVGLFDVSHMGRLTVSGGDAFRFLQYVSVNDLERLPEAGGAGQYSLLCRDAGGVIDDIIIYKFNTTNYQIVVNASNADKDIAWLRHHATKYHDLTIREDTEATGLIAVQGPNAVEMLDNLCDDDLVNTPRFGFLKTNVAGVAVLAARTGYTGEDGYELFCRAEDAVTLWNALTNAGGVPCGLGARDTLRIEAALPLYGHEMDEHVMPFEARLGWVVRADKEADYVGRNVLEDLRAAPKHKVLVGLEMQGRAIARDGYMVEAAGEKIGVITSGTFSPVRERGIALARVSAAHGKRGAVVDVVVRETRHSATVVPLPFVKNA